MASSGHEHDDEGLRLLTVREVADYLRCSQQQVRRMIADGTLPRHDIATRLVRVRATDLRAYIIGSATSPSGVPVVKASEPPRPRRTVEDGPMARSAVAREGFDDGDTPSPR